MNQRNRGAQLPDSDLFLPCGDRRCRQVLLFHAGHKRLGAVELLRFQCRLDRVHRVLVPLGFLQGNYLGPQCVDLGSVGTLHVGAGLRNAFGHDALVFVDCVAKRCVEIALNHQERGRIHQDGRIR